MVDIKLTDLPAVSSLVDADILAAVDIALDQTSKITVADLRTVIAAGFDHGALAGLGDDDHTQYSLVTGTRAFTGVVKGVTPVADADLATKGYVDGVAVADHGGLTGLGDDDHTQYILADGTRAFSGNVLVSAQILRIDDGAPTIRLFESDQAADLKSWQIQASAAVLSLSTRSDDFSTGNTFMRVTRSGTSPTQVIFDADVLIQDVLGATNDPVLNIQNDKAEAVGDETYLAFGSLVRSRAAIVAITKNTGDGTGALELRTNDGGGTVADNITAITINELQNVGINIDPDALAIKLQVDGDITIVSDTDTFAYKFRKITGAVFLGQMQYEQADEKLYLNTHDGAAGNVNRIRIAGNQIATEIGIGRDHISGRTLAIAGDVEIIDGNLIIDRASGDANIIIDSIAGTNRTILCQTAGSNRWTIGTAGDAESGSDAGSSFSIDAKTDAGASIDQPIVITRAAGGTITLNRPVTIVNVNGIDINPGSDIDADLITVGVTGTPVIKWDESEDAFSSNKNLIVNADLTVISGTPRYILDETGAAVDNRRWDIAADNESLQFRMLNDAESLIGIWCSVARTGIVIDEIRFDTAAAGFVRYGIHTALAAETLSGFIQIKDSTGTIRKLGVIS